MRLHRNEPLQRHVSERIVTTAQHLATCNRYDVSYFWVVKFKLSSFTSSHDDPSTETETVAWSLVACWLRQRKQRYQQVAQAKQYCKHVSS